MTCSWTARRYSVGDEPSIVDLLNTTFGKWGGLEYWKWRYERNPAGSPIIWLAESNGKIVGHYGLTPRVMKIGNMYVRGSLAADAATHPDYRGRGVFSCLANKCLLDASARGITLTYGFANTRLAATYKRYEQIGHISFMTRLIKVLNWKSVLRTYLGKRPTEVAASDFLSFGSSSNDNLTIERIARFDGAIDRLWAAVAHRFTVVVRRDQTYLNWRYTNNPSEEYAIYAGIKDDRILGYCVLKTLQWKGFTIGAIVDILGDEDEVIRSLICTGVDWLKDHGADLVLCSMCEAHPFRNMFRSTGFVAYPPLSRDTALYATINLQGESIDERSAYSQSLLLSQSPFLKSKGNWFMMSGDGWWA